MVNHFLLIILFFGFFNYSFSQENDPYAEIADIIASKKTPMDECNEYVNARGWKQFVPFNIGNKKILIICGSSTINEPPSSNNFFSSRSIAFDLAILDAQRSYAEFRSNKVSEKISFKLQEGFGLQQENPIERDNELTQEIEEKIFNKLLKLANQELEKKIEENNIEINKEKEWITEEIKKLNESTVFSKTVNTSTQISINGLQSFKVWESCREGQKLCKLAILTVRTAEQGFLARSLINPTNSFIRGEPSKIIPAKFSPKQVLANAGTRIKRDENGDYFILATAISNPKNQTAVSEKIAYEKAKVDAFGMIRRFAGSKIQSKTEKTVDQIYNQYQNGDDENVVLDKFKQETESISDQINIKGIKIHDSGSIIHPANKKLIAKYVIAKWSIGSQSKAINLNKKNKKEKSTSIKSSEPIQQETEIISEESDF